MMQPTTKATKPQSKPLAEDTEERKKLVAAVSKIFQNRAKEAEKELKKLS